LLYHCETPEHRPPQRDNLLIYHNERARDVLGGLNSADLLLWSFDFERIETLESQSRWDETAVLMVDAARRLETAGAEALL
jgi:aspartate racemase